MTKVVKGIVVFLVIAICLVIIAFVFAVPTLEQKAGHEIIQQLKEKLDAKVELKTLRLSSLWPLGLRVQSLKIMPRSGKYRAEVDRVFFRYHYLFGSYVEVDIQRPFLEWIGAPPSAPNDIAAEASPQPSAPNRSLAAFLAGLGAELKVSEGVISWQKDENTQIRLEQLDADVRKAKLLNEAEPLKLQISSVLTYRTPWVKGQTTVQAHTSDLKVSASEASSKKSELQVGGLVLQAAGVSNFTSGTHDWNVKASIDDLQKLPKPPDFLPAQNWKGKIQLDTTVHVAKDDVGAQGWFKFEQVAADLKWNSPMVRLEGPAKLNTSGSFEYDKSGYSLKNLALNADLTSTNVEYSNLFRKPATVSLTLDYQGAFASNSLDIHAMKLQFYNLKAEAQGQMPLDGNGQVQWQIAPVSLNGWERLIPPLAQTPLQGNLEMKGAISGSFQRPQELGVNVSRLLLKGFKGQIKYQSSDGSTVLAGPVSADLNGHISTQGANVRAAEMTLVADLSPLLIKDQGIFEKKAGEALKISVSAKQSQQDIGIDKSTFTLPFGTIGIAGRVHNMTDPSLDLNVVADVTSLEVLKGYLASLKDWPVTGVMRANLGIKGKPVMSEPWFNWPLNISGQVHYATPKLVFVSTDSKAPSDHAGKAASNVPPGPFLQRGYLTENLSMSVDANVGKIVRDRLTLESTAVKGRIAKGVYSGRLTTHAFGGTAHLQGFALPLFERDPVIKTDLSFDGIEISSILDYFQPAFSAAAKGPVKGTAKVESLLPASPQFLSRLRAAGQVSSDNVWINTMMLARMINDQLSKIPGVPKDAVKLEPMHGRMDGEFKMEHEIVNPLSVNGYDHGGSELHLKGSASLDKTVDLSGEFRWAQAPLSGCLKEGNADSKGRVVVPIALKGPVTSPSWSFATDLIAKMGEKALRCQAVKTIKQNLPSGVGDQLEKQLKGLLGH